MSKVVITGAASNIGLALVDICLKNNDEVIALVRPNSKNNTKLINHPNLKVIAVDVCDIENCNVKLDADIFYHLAWSGVERNIRNNPNVQLANVKYTIDAINLANRLGCKKFIGAGSQAEYGPKKDEIITENTNIDPNIAYGVGKYTAGKFGKILCEGLNMEFNWARIFSVYGINDGDGTMITSTMNKMINNEPIDFTDATQLWEYTYSTDCAKALYLIGKYGKNMETYNISTGDYHELKYYILKMKKIINSDSILNFGAIKANGPQTNLACNIDKLKNDTGFNPEISFDEGISLILKAKTHK